jgi:protein-S-isoprenylcysteine O-methyltransferase Ste14
MGRHLIQDPQVETVAGVAAIVAGWWLLYDAWDQRGRSAPWLLRRLMW